MTLLNTNNNHLSYFKIGTFVLVGIGLIIFALLIFGSSRLFQKVIYVETYFDESIQGVSEGTPVKYRGYQIGYVKEIAFTSEVYKQDDTLDREDPSRSIYVKIAITSKLFTHRTFAEASKFWANEVAIGLRVKLVAQGLTGNSYLELNYVDPKANPVPNLDWKPNVFYIPSVTSTLTRLSENAQVIMNELRNVNFERLFGNFSILINSLARVTSKTDQLLDQINGPFVSAVQNLKVVSDDLRVVSKRVRLKPSEIIFSSYPPPLDPKKL
jgi:ABC-type transporter Mla subunit MlaD